MTAQTIAPSLANARTALPGIIANTWTVARRELRESIGSRWFILYTFAFAALGLGLCNIDQPLFHRSVKPAAHTTSSVGYVRLHGRNYQNWFSPTSDVRARYDYLYRPEELEPWVSRIKYSQ